MSHDDTADPHGLLPEQFVQPPRSSWRYRLCRALRQESVRTVRVGQHLKKGRKYALYKREVE